MDGLVSLAFVVGAVFLRPGERRIMSEWSRASDPWLIFDCVEDFVDRELLKTDFSPPSPVSWSGWRKLSSPFQVGCKAELG